MDRLINDNRFLSYNKKTVIIPIKDWIDGSKNSLDYLKNINPISVLIRLIFKGSPLLQNFGGTEFVFLTDKGYLKVDPSTLTSHDLTQLKVYLTKLVTSALEDIQDDEVTKDSPQAIKVDIVDKIETSQKVEIDNITGDSGSADKDELVKKIDTAAKTANDVSNALDDLDGDDKIKQILAHLADEEDNTVKVNAARTARLNKVNDEFLNSKFQNTTVKEILEAKEVELPKTELKIDSVNEEWKNLSYINFEKSYDINKDILAILNSLSQKTVPVVVRDLQVEDTSTSEDYKDTYTAHMEDANGKRFTLKFDIPKMKDDKFMILRGNEKTINGQLMLLPISKTDDDTVQMVSNYNKIFIRRFGTTTGKSFVVTDRIIKALKKDGHDIKISIGDNTRISAKYELPIDYIDLATVYSKLETKDTILYFNQDEIREKYKDIIDLKKGIPIGYNKGDKSILYYMNEDPNPLSYIIMDVLCRDAKFATIYDGTSISTKYTYSKASILSNEIPLIVIMSYNEGLVKAMKKAHIKYEFKEKREKINKNMHDMIRFKDGYIVYELDYNSSLLMNGLKECNTEDYSLEEVNSRSMYLDFLDLFGGRILADGLDNFYDGFICPMTKKILIKYQLPTDYVELLAYANLLLSDNKYIKHGDLSSNRFRTNEIIAGYAYKAIYDAYGSYRTQLKKNKKDATMSMKQAAVIDALMVDPTSADLSTLNPLLEMESINAVSFKGLAGMNSDRSYGLDKRTYDESMLNILGLSTGFAGNVGITRQATIDMNIDSNMGYIKVSKDPDKFSVTKTFTATEAMTPYGTTRDDPFRSAMTFIQTSKHAMRIKNGSPLLVTNGMDEALPYLITNTFAFKSKEKGKVIEKTDDYMIVQYKSGKNDFIDLRENVKKNSNGGFYTSIKLDTDLKVGSTFNENQILAYDKLSFSDKIGHTNDIGYNLGALAKVAIMNTDEGYEDSAIISEYLSDAMASDVVLCKDVSLPKSTNVYNMVKKGDAIKEGDPLLIYQNAFDEEDANALLKNLVGDDEEISNLGRIKVKSKVEGVVDDIKVYRTVEKEELSESLRKTVEQLEKPITTMRKIMAKYSIEDANRFNSDYKLDPTGKLKNCRDGVLIEFYLKYNDKMSVGDKLIYYSALKGVVKDIFPAGKEPYTDFRKNEKIHSLLSLGSVNGRMVTSILINGSLNKLLIELDRTVKTMLGIPFKYLDEK